MAKKDHQIFQSRMATKDMMAKPVAERSPQTKTKEPRTCFLSDFLAKMEIVMMETRYGVMVRRLKISVMMGPSLKSR